MYSSKKLLISMVCCSLFALTLQAQNYHHEKKQAIKEKYRELPRGLKKKLHRTGELPRGWKKKLIVGKKFDPIFVPHAVEVTQYRYYNKHIEKSPREKIYQVEDKIIKVMAATNIILDVFEVE